MTAGERMKICGFLCLVPAACLAARLFYLQTFRHGELAGKAESRTYTQTAQNTLRGRILDRSGIVLAESLRTYAVAVSKKNVNDAEGLIKALSEVLGLKPADVKKSWREKKNFFYVKKHVSPPEYEALESRLRSAGLRGVEIEPEYTRIYPFDGIAQDILGAVNSRNKGLSGIELMYNKELSEELESRRVKRARSGGIIYDKSQLVNADTADVYLTIDAVGQYYTESILKKYAQRHGVKNAFAIVQDSRNGNILAAASYPALDGRALPFQFSYEPGSTFKTLAVAAALDTGAIKPSDIIDMENNKWTISGITIRDHQKKPALTISEILEVSSNIGAAKIADKVGAKTMYAYIKKFGFGVRSSVGFLGEQAGILREHTRWRPVDTAKAGYGYTISATAVQIVSAYSAIANGGTLMAAHLIEKIKFADGRETVIAKPARIRRAIEETTAAQLRTMLVNVVQHGTGKGAQIAGYSVAGKTGTTEKLAHDGKYGRSLHIASFCGFVPASAPRFTILVVLDEPEKALFGSVSANIFADIGQKFLNLSAVQPDMPQENIEP
ncbi:MAG: penicillin-binding protein 2 [Elusimicrobiota bacterium]|jgi:cell division protein FtsI (penicillin-binding protein 3)|nr:penicillin-binding protein 2 [Elusimicrobiota bacterium]